MKTPRPDSAAARAERLNAEGRPDEALAEAGVALADDPDDARARFARAFALSLLGRHADAEAALDALLAGRPGHADAAWLRAGLARRRLGDADPRTLAAYDAALPLAPDNPYLAAERADVLRAHGRHGEARETFARVAGDAPDEALRAEAAFLLALSCLVLGDTPAARAALRQVLDAAPDYPDAGALYASLGGDSP